MAPKQLHNLVQNRDMLAHLAKCSQNSRNKILHNGEKPLIEAICQIVHNVLEGNIPINEKTKHQLSKYRQSLRTLTDKNSLKKKKKILVQNGGFLPLLLSAVLPFLPTIISSVAEVTSKLVSNSNQDTQQ